MNKENLKRNIALFCIILVTISFLWACVDYYQNRTILKTDPCFACERDFGLSCFGNYNNENKICWSFVDNDYNRTVEKCIKNKY